MARPTITQIRNLGDFAALFRWNVSFSTLPSALAGSYNTNDLNFRCESFATPKVTGSTIEVGIRGQKVRQPGIYEYDKSLTLIFAGTVDGYIHRFFRDWREACWVTGEGRSKAPKAELTANIELIQLDNMDKPFWMFRLIGAFLESFDFGTLDGTSSDIQKPNLIITYDYFEDKAYTG